MISLNDLSIAYGQKLLFYDVNLTLNNGNTYVLVGANGAGKSTFFKLLTGEEELTSGSILMPKEASIGWLKQDQFRYEDTIIRDIVLQGKPELWNALQERDALLADDAWDDKKMHRFSLLEEIIMHHEGYMASTAIEQLLSGLGIDALYFDKPLKSLSGGYKLRVLLAKTLFQNPSILLLDEPTNHLDIISIRWLEKFLKTAFKGLLIFISHDMDFIDNLAEYILDIDYGDIRQYKGNYARFLNEKATWQAQKLLEKQSAEAKIKEMQKFVDRFKAKASKAAQAQSRVKMIEKIEMPDIKNTSRVAPHFQFTVSKPSVKNVLTVSNLSKSFKDKPLFSSLNFKMTRGEKLVIMGANGTGKSTLIKLLMNLLPADKGEVLWGSEVRISYFSQDHHDLLNESISALKWLEQTVSSASEQQIRKQLGQMLFVKDDAHKDVLTLSGGESARLLLAKVMLEQPNIIMLDEPTNHMDLETIEALGEALSNFPGTVICVSHNRHFINRIATRIIYFSTAGRIHDVQGSYADFMAKNIE